MSDEQMSQFNVDAIRNALESRGEWLPGLGDRVIITFPLGGSQTEWAGEITWHGMLNDEWGGFSVTLDEKHPAFTQTVGPYRADHFKEIARPEEPKMNEEQTRGYAILNDLLNFSEKYGQNAIFNIFDMLALPWREESTDIGTHWYRRSPSGKIVCGPVNAYERERFDKMLKDQEYTLLEEK